MTRPHITILGMPGSGKSTLADFLAERAGLPHRDGDEALASGTGATAETLAARDGIDALHEIERSIARRLLADDEPAIVTPAAAVLDDADTTALVRQRSWLVAVLDADAELLAARSAAADHRRPMAIDELGARWADRRPPAVAIADVVLDATRPVEELAAHVVATIRAC